MKFFCEKCNTKYAIADDKVHGKVLKIRCKKCSNIIVVRELVPEGSGPRTAPRPTPAAPPARAPVATGPAPRPAPAPVARPVPVAATRPAPAARPAPAQPAAPLAVEIPTAPSRPQPERPVAARPTAAAKAAPRAREPSAPQRVAKASEPAAAAAVATRPRPEPMQPASTQPADPAEQADQVVWYLAQRGQQSPPLTRARISQMIRSREVNERVYAWNQTLPNWQRIVEVRAFAPDFEWLRQQEAGGKVVDFQKRVAELKRQQSKVQRQLAVEALDQIADLVQSAPAPQPAARPAASDLVKPAQPTALTPRKTAQTQQPAARAPAPAVSAQQPLPETVIADADRSAEADFFDPSSVVSYGDAPVIVTDPSPEVSARMRASGVPTINTGPFDPFAFVPDIPEPNEPVPPRESTRVFLQQVGLSGRRRLVKVVAGVGLALMLISVTVALDVFGVIAVPGLHAYIESVKERRAAVALSEPEVEKRMTREEKETVAHALLIGDLELANKVRQQVRHRAVKKGVKEAAQPIDLSDQVQGGSSTLDDATRRGAGQAQQVELSKADKEALADLVKRPDTKQVAIQIKPGISEIRLPKRHQGGLSSSQVGAVVAENQEGIKRCATAETKYGLELPPAITVAATIARNGAVTAAVANEAQYRNTQLARCLVSMVRKWRFPEFTGEPMEVEIPFKFTTTM